LLKPPTISPAACRPLLAHEGLSESLVDPALAFLAKHGAEVRFGARVRALEFVGDRVVELSFDTGTVALPAEDAVILAVPAAIAARLVPELVVPDDYAPIVNAHFRCAAPTAPAFIGLVGGTAEWVFRKREVLSVTVSAADRIVDRPAEELREALKRSYQAADKERVSTLINCQAIKEFTSGRDYPPGVNLNPEPGCGAVAH